MQFKKFASVSAAALALSALVAVDVDAAEAGNLYEPPVDENGNLVLGVQEESGKVDFPRFEDHELKEDDSKVDFPIFEDHELKEDDGKVDFPRFKDHELKEDDGKVDFPIFEDHELKEDDGKVDFPIFEDHELKEDDGKIDFPLFKDHELKEEKSVDLTAGYDNLADAVVAAETAIANDEVNNGYDISLGADGKYYIALTVEANNGLKDLLDFDKKDEKAEEKEEDKKEAQVDPAAGFENLADAIANAEAFLKQSPNIGYNIAKGADGKYYAAFSLTDDSKVIPAAELKAAKKADKKFEDLFDFDKMKELHQAYNKKQAAKKVQAVSHKEEAAPSKEKAVQQEAEQVQALPQTGAASASLALGAAAIVSGLGLAGSHKKED